MTVLPKRQSNFSDEHKKIIRILVPLFLIIALPFVLLAARQQTEDRHYASEFHDFNSSAEIGQSNNPDGTMGPSSANANYSSTLSGLQLGTVTLVITNSTDAQVTTIPTQAFSDGARNSSMQHWPTEVTSLRVNFSKAEVHLANMIVPPVTTAGTHTISPLPDRSNGTWETLNINAPRTVDLVELAKGNFALFGMTNLAAGQYTEIRLYISTASAGLANGTNGAVAMPGKNNIVRIVRPFIVDAGGVTTVTVDFDVWHSLHATGDGYIFKPVVSQLIESHGAPLTPGPSPIISSITPPNGCYYQKHICTIVCPITHPDCCPSVLICPSGTPSISPQPTCFPRPACLDAVPRCLIPEPNGGWCTTTPTPMRCGGFIQNPPACPTGYVCDHAGINPDLPGRCMALSPTQQISPMPTAVCLPKPSCLTSNPPTCELPEPIGGWCPSPTGGQLSGGQLNVVMTYLNNILRALLKTR